MVKVYVDVCLLVNVEMWINKDEIDVDDEHVFVVKLDLVSAVICHWMMMMMLVVVVLLLKQIEVRVNRPKFEQQTMTKVLLDR